MKKFIVLMLALIPVSSFSQQPINYELCSNYDDSTTFRTPEFMNFERVDSDFQTVLLNQFNQSPRVVVCIEKESESKPSYGLFNVEWDMRDIAAVEIIKVGDSYVTANIAEFSELKAPLGGWRIVENGKPPGFYEPNFTHDIAEIMSYIANTLEVELEAENVYVNVGAIPW